MTARATAASACAAALLCLASGCTLACDEVRVVSPDGATRLVACATWATTAEARRRGLVGTKPGEVEALVLDFPVVGEVCLTNAGVAYAIDALWADDAGAVVAIERALPANAPGPWCAAPTRWVVEVPAGVAATVEPGDQLVHPR